MFKLMFIFNFLTSEYHDAVFVVGALDETLILRGMRYHPIDIELSVLRAHKKIAEWYDWYLVYKCVINCLFVVLCSLGPTCWWWLLSWMEMRMKH